MDCGARMASDLTVKVPYLITSISISESTFPSPLSHTLPNFRRSRNVAPPMLNPNLFQKFVLCLRNFFQWQRVMRLPRVHCLDILALQQKSSKLSTRRGLCKWPYANVNVCRPGAGSRPKGLNKVGSCKTVNQNTIKLKLPWPRNFATLDVVFPTPISNLHRLCRYGNQKLKNFCTTIYWHFIVTYILCTRQEKYLNKQIFTTSWSFELISAQ